MRHSIIHQMHILREKDIGDSIGTTGLLWTSTREECLPRWSLGCLSKTMTQPEHSSIVGLHNFNVKEDSMSVGSNKSSSLPSASTRDWIRSQVLRSPSLLLRSQLTFTPDHRPWPTSSPLITKHSTAQEQALAGGSRWKGRGNQQGVPTKRANFKRLKRTATP
ncbi:hypothetical protein B0O80DRAFT_491838 [Mortierella sp. GBAus27b]|nr:hypothetical protein B0O80DRAFT_491838 [Mortierella sp. GBAus27b]